MNKEINILPIYLFTMKRAGLEKMKRNRPNRRNINIFRYYRYPFYFGVCKGYFDLLNKSLKESFYPIILQNQK